MNQNQLGKWLPILKKEFDKPYMQELNIKLLGVPDSELCPARENIFRAYSSTPPNEVKVVIVGLDPYTSVPPAHGLSFSCETGKTPPSLRIIFNELLRSGIHTEKRTNPNLSDWAAQGVLLLNTVLTTERKKTLAHGTWGWQEFTGATLRYLAENDRPIIFLSWGNDALDSMSKYVVPFVSSPSDKLILRSCHPAAELYGRKKFTGNNQFTFTNQWLMDKGLNPIKW